MEQGVKRKANPRMLKIWKTKPNGIFFWRRKTQREQWVTLKIKRPTSPACRPTTPHIISGLRPQIHSTERSLGDGHKTKLQEDPKANLFAPLLLPPSSPPRACENAKSAEEELCTLEDPTAVVLEDPRACGPDQNGAGIRNGNKSP
jgi:hypothetical protein